MTRLLPATVLLGACLTISLPARAQTSNNPLAFVQAEVLPYSQTSGATQQRFQVGVFRAKLGFPVLLNQKRTILLPSLSHETLHAWGDSDVENPSVPRHYRFQSFLAEMGLMQILGGGWGVNVALGGGLASDFHQSITPGDWVLTSRTLATVRTSSNLTFGFGAGYDRRTGVLTLIPLGMLQWEVSSKWLVDLLVPKSGVLSYRAAPWFTASLRGEFDYNRFHLSPDRYGADNLYLRYEAVKVGPCATFSASDLLHFDLYAGVAFVRNLDVFHKSASFGLDYYANSTEPDHSVTLSPNLVGGVRAWVGFERLPKKPK